MLDAIKTAWDKDLPQNAITKLNETCEQFVKEKDYEGLLVFFKLCLPFSDMLADTIIEIINREEIPIFEYGGEPLRALYLMIKGVVLKNKTYFSPEVKEIFKQAMEHPEELEIPLEDFDWFIENDSCHVLYDRNNHPIFGHDLLSYIAQETRQYNLLAKYHKKNSNSDAECYAHCIDIIENFIGGRNGLSEFIENNVDTPVSLFAVKALIERHFTVKNRFLPIEERNQNVSKIIDKIRSFMKQFAQWPDIGMATRLLEKMAEPEVNKHTGKECILPNRPYSFTIERKNVARMMLSVYHSAIKSRGNHHDIDSDVIERSFEEKPVFQKEYIYDENDKFLWQSSTMEIGPLKPGLYKVVVRADGRICIAEKIRVSQLCLLAEPLPKNKKRIVVLDAETGLPVPHAYIHYKTDQIICKSKIFKCDEKGEKVSDSTNKNVSLYPFTKEDQWADEVCIGDWDSYSYDKLKPRDTGDILTDRSIYRSGQTVHITIVCYHINASNQVKTIQRNNVEICIRNEDGWNIVWKEKVKTDEYGVATIDFHIPEEQKPCELYISCEIGGYKSIRVEEYKRPTFEVRLEPYTKPYKMGDTITVRGKAINFAGVPVANAKVNYIIKSKESSWFFRLSYFWNIKIDTFRFITKYETDGHTRTDHNGNFQIEVPMLVGISIKEHIENIPLSLDIVAYADVVDVTGETQCGTISMPLSNREHVLYAEVEYRIEKSDGFEFTPFVRNSAGKIHECEINYRVDDGKWHTAHSGKKVLLYDIELGKHILQLEYDGEKAQREFILFDRDSSFTPCETDYWEYLSSNVFPKDGSPVIIQVGDSTPGTRVIYDIFSGINHITSGATKTGTGMIRWELPYDPKYGNGILVNFAWVRNQEVQHCSMTIKKPLPDMKLNLNWLSWQGVYIPGEHVKWMAKIDNPNELLVPSNIVAVVYDKALDLLCPHSWDEFGPKLEWNVPDTEWQYGNHIVPRRYWSANSSPFEDGAADCICCGESSVSGHKYGHYNRIVPYSDKGNPMMFKLRSNFAETAYYVSNIRSNDKGEIEIEFDLPDTLTTWKLMVVAFTQDMHWCTFEKEFISRKDIMVQANMPRFTRVGDHTVVTAKVTNQSGQNMKETVCIELLDEKSREKLISNSKSIEIETDSTKAVSFHFKPDEEVEQYVCRVFAKNDEYSDGEERMISVLPDKTMVVTSHVFDQNGAGFYQVHPNGLFPIGTTHQQLSLDYTNNAVWLAVNAMKDLVKYDKENAISLTVALYSALLTKHLKEQVIGESNKGNIDDEINNLKELLGKLQHSDGGFSWYKGMPSSEYVTTEVLMHLSRLSAIIEIPEKMTKMMENGFRYIDKRMHKTVKELRMEEREGGIVRIPSFMVLQHLYKNAISGRTIPRRNRDDFDYLVKLMLLDIHRQTIYEKAMSAIILKHVGRRDLALEYVESLYQYTKMDEERGRSFKTSRATYSWYSFKIPTHVAAMEAIHRICPDRRQEIVEMQKWLLNEKRTQTWETPIDSVNAIHALLFGNNDTLHEKITTAISVDGRMLECETEGKEGHLKAELDPGAQLISFDKKSKGISWGAVYAKFLQPLSEVSASVSGMTIKREIIAPKAGLHVGDRITVRLTYSCDRNYDMVEVVDSKAACMEPVKQLSWSDSFKHVASYDTKTVISYYGLAEGTYSMETEFWLDRPGAYEIGLATIQCAYAPEFRATCPSQRLVVLP